MTKKRKTLFNHLDAIYTDQSVGYYDSLSVEDRKTYQSFMINRFISMNMDYVGIVNELQKHWDAIKDRESYLFFSQLLPMGKQWNKYIKAKKGEKERKCEDWILELLALHYSISQREAKMYFETFMNTPEGQLSLKELFEDYGVEPKKIKKIVRVRA